MCRWDNENWPIHLPNLDQKLDPYISRWSKFAPILRIFGKMYVKFPQMWEIFFENFVKICYWKKRRPIELPKVRFEKGSFIYQRGENGTLFRGTSPIPHVTWIPSNTLPKVESHWRYWGKTRSRHKQMHTFTSHQTSIIFCTEDLDHQLPSVVLS